MTEKPLFQTHHIDGLHSGLTVEEYLKNKLAYSARKRQKLTRIKGGIFLNNKTTFLKRQLKENDILKIRLLPDTDYGVTPEQGNIEILYEDEFMVVVNKPPFKLVHPAGNTTGNTLANHLAYYFKEHNTVCTIRPIHRLDRDTSGCIIFAKDAHSQTKLEHQLKNNQLKRCYHAIVTGLITPPDGMINAPIAKDKQSPNRRIVHAVGLPAITHYRTLANYPNQTLLELHLETGRTHQIRVHLAHLGHPIIGDKMYGTRSPLISRQALHAAKITFQHLNSNERLTITAPLPDDMTDICT